MKARKALFAISIRSKISKITSANGCEYSLEFPEDKFYEVIAELKKEGIKYNLIG